MRFAAILSAALVSTAALAAPGSGDLWEVTSQISMTGMPAGYQMPARTSEVCSAKEWTKPPVQADEERKCEFVDFKNTPAKSTWKMRCAGPPAVSGDGEISRQGDTYKGVINMSSEAGEMKMNISGRRIGDCDAEAAVAQRDAQMARVQAQVAAGEQMAADAQKQACLASVESLNPQLLEMQATMCDPATYKPMLCERASADAGFKTVMERKQDQAGGLAAVAKYCGFDAAARLKEECAEAATGESDLVFLAKHCPVEAAPIAQRECAGRTYTSLGGSKYAPFCGTYAASNPAPEASPAPDAKTKAKKTLKSLFGK